MSTFSWPPLLGLIEVEDVGGGGPARLWKLLTGPIWEATTRRAGGAAILQATSPLWADRVAKACSEREKWRARANTSNTGGCVWPQGGMDRPDLPELHNSNRLFRSSEGPTHLARCLHP